MLVPLDLCALVQRNGRLTPELVIGWRTAGYLREFFDGLDCVRVAAAAEGDLGTALRLTWTESRFPLDVLWIGTRRPWHVLAYHPPAGTALEIVFNPVRVGMDDAGRAMEEGLRAGDPIAAAAYSASLDRQVRRLMELPFDAICRIRERIVVRSRSIGSGAEPVRCRQCARLVDASELWHADGVPCCMPCVGFPPEWMAGH
jgi:hypothetical protein